MHIALQFTYNIDVIFVPDNIGKDIKAFQNLFDKWLYDKNNDHGYWVVVDGQKVAVSFDADAFVDYLNRFHLANGQEKAYIVHKDLDAIPNTCCAKLFF